MSFAFNAFAITCLAGPTFIHMIIGNVVEPMVFGQSMELHPVTVLLALALWYVYGLSSATYLKCACFFVLVLFFYRYALWGIPGAILAVPITGVMPLLAFICVFLPCSTF